MRPILEAAGLQVRAGRTTILAGIDLVVPSGGLIAVVGPNGAGKSTLLAALMGYLPASAGEVRIGGQRIGDLSGRQRAARVAWLPQRGAFGDGLTVLEVVAAARYRLAAARGDALQAARLALAEVGLPDLADRLAPSLSGGEAQRVALAALIAQGSDAWLLDEPANHLDPAVRRQVLSVLLRAWRGGQALVIVLHDLDWLAAQLPPEEADRVTVVGLSRGRVAFQRALSDPDLAGALSAMYGVAGTDVAVAGRRRLIVVP